jgi:hypothetical protein
MSAYRIAQNSREIHIMSVGASRGMRTLLIRLARAAAPHLRDTYARAARTMNHDMVRDMRAARISGDTHVVREG